MPDKQGNNNEIGKGRPPIHTRWKKGQSGNPRGRPRKDVCITSLIKEMLDKPADYIAPGATPDDKTWCQMIAKAILLGAAKGNPAMIKELLDRLEGKVSQPIESPQDRPFEVKVIEKVKDYGHAS